MQRCYFFKKMQQLDSNYGASVGAGVSYTPGRYFTLAADVLASEFLFPNKTFESVLTIAGSAGYHTAWKAPVGLSAELGIGCSVCYTASTVRPYLEIPLSLGATYRLNEGSELFLKARVDDILLFCQEMTDSSLSVVVTPLVGYSKKF